MSDFFPWIWPHFTPSISLSMCFEHLISIPCVSVDSLHIVPAILFSVSSVLHPTFMIGQSSVNFMVFLVVV